MTKFNQFLSGVRVLDLSRYIPGPMAGLFLADMGADVLKIEPPAGDEMQFLGPRDDEGRPIFYRSMNAGKSVLQIDLKDPAERDSFCQLVRNADVLIEGFRPGVMTRLGLDHSALADINPQLIFCSISGYGANSALGAKAGHDANYLAAMGILDRNGDSGPVIFDPPISDIAGSLFAVTAILGALHGRRSGAGGCHIDMALADTVMPMQMMQVAGFGANGAVPHRGGSYLNGGAAYYQVYRTRDANHVILGAVENKFWIAFCQAAGKPEWIRRRDDPIPQNDLHREVSEYFFGLSLEEADARFEAVDCCYSAVRNLRDALSLPHIGDRDLVRRSSNGELQALFPARFDGLPPQSRPDLTEASAAGGWASLRPTHAQSVDGTKIQSKRGKSWR